MVSRLTFETLQHAEFANRDATSLAYKIHTHNLLGSRGARNKTGEMNINEINLEKLDFFQFLQFVISTVHCVAADFLDKKI